MQVGHPSDIPIRTPFLQPFGDAARTALVFLCPTNPGSCGLAESALEYRNALHVMGVREHIDERHRRQAVASIGQQTTVPAE